MKTNAGTVTAALFPFPADIQRWIRNKWQLPLEEAECLTVSFLFAQK